MHRFSPVVGALLLPLWVGCQPTDPSPSPTAQSPTDPGEVSPTLAAPSPSLPPETGAPSPTLPEEATQSPEVTQAPTAAQTPAPTPAPTDPATAPLSTEPATERPATPTPGGEPTLPPPTAEPTAPVGSTEEPPTVTPGEGTHSPTPVSSPLVVLTDKGYVEGIPGEYNTWSWLGIPFAAPPVESARWRPPTPPEPWEGVLTTDHFGPTCTQTEGVDQDGDGENEYIVIGEEDCLYLNVWRPTRESRALRPIMFWIHGGGNVNGTANNPLYYGAHLADEADVVVVTIQYRLGPMGWLLHPSLQTGEPAVDSGSPGTYDVIRALEWVRDNGAAFGGDTSRVTVFGESAGGVNTWSMVQTPLAEGLIHRAIVESGCPAFKSIDQMTRVTQDLLEQLVVADGLATEEEAASFLEKQGDVWIHDYLYGKTSQEILSVFIDDGGTPLSTFGPVQDGYLLPLDNYQALMDGDYNKVPLILGANRDEEKLFYASLYNMSQAQYAVLMAALFGENVEEVEALYPRSAYDPATPYNQFTDILDQTLELLCGLYPVTMVWQNSPTWQYYFTFDQLTEPYPYILGAAHGLELPFVFGTYLDSENLYPAEELELRQALSSEVMSYWGCFAASGDPNCGQPLAWPTSRGDTEAPFQRLIIDAPMSVAPAPALDWERVNYWIDYYDLPLPKVELP